MIDFRYHIVSLIAVFMALALGLFLGSTTLQSTVTNNLKSRADQVTAENRRDEAANSALTTSIKNERAFIASLGPYAVDGRLTGESVALVSAPGVSGDDVKAMTSDIEAAGGSVSASVQLQSAYLDSTQDAELGSLATHLKLPHHRLPAGNGSTEISAVLAAVLAERPGHAAVAKTHVEQVLSALADGKFISVLGSPPTHAATLAVLLVPAPSTSLSQLTEQAQTSVLTSLAAQLRRDTTTTVVAGPDATATPSVPNQVLAAVRADSTLSMTLSTVDFGSVSDDAAAGRVAVVLALGDPSGTAGDYGLGQQPPVPVATTTP